MFRDWNKLDRPQTGSRALRRCPVGETHTGRVVASHGGCPTHCGLRRSAHRPGLLRKISLLPLRGKWPRNKVLQIVVSSRSVARYEHPTHVRARVAQSWKRLGHNVTLLSVTALVSLPAAPILVVGRALCDGVASHSRTVWAFGLGFLLGAVLEG